MKVCAVTTWPPHRDGVALYSAELYKQMAESVDVVVVANIPKQQGLPESREGKDISVLRCWKRGPWYPPRIFYSALKTRAHLVHLQHGWLLYGDFLPSILFPLLLFFFRLSRKPCVVTMHTVIRKDAPIYANPLVNFLARIAILSVSRCIVQFSDKVIVHNPLMKKILQTEYNTKKEKIVIIPHGVKKSPKKPESSREGKTIRILSLGFLRRGKGMECLVEAFEKFLEKYSDSKLVIVGGSHAHDRTGYSESFKHLLTPAIQKQVMFTGFVNEKRLEQLIWESDIIVLQSTEPYYVEASGALAAVADYGKPVVCSKVPKFQNELQNGEHYLAVEPSDSTELAQTLVSLMKDEELRNRLGKNLREKFKSRRWNAVAEGHINLYNRLLKA